MTKTPAPINRLWNQAIIIIIIIIIIIMHPSLQSPDDYENGL